MKHLCHYICLISYTNILQSYDYLVLPFIHCYLLFVAFSNKIYAPVSFKIVLKNLLVKFCYTRIWLENMYSKNVVHETRRQVHKKHGFVNITSFNTNLLNILMTL